MPTSSGVKGMLESWIHGINERSGSRHRSNGFMWCMRCYPGSDAAAPMYCSRLLVSRICTCPLPLPLSRCCRLLAITIDGWMSVLADLLDKRICRGARTIGDGYTACGFGAEINDFPRVHVGVSHWVKVVARGSECNRCNSMDSVIGGMKLFQSYRLCFPPWAGDMSHSFRCRFVGHFDHHLCDGRVPQ